MFCDSFKSTLALAFYSSTWSQSITLKIAEQWSAAAGILPQVRMLLFAFVLELKNTAESQRSQQRPWGGLWGQNPGWKQGINKTAKLKLRGCRLVTRPLSESHKTRKRREKEKCQMKRPFKERTCSVAQWAGGKQLNYRVKFYPPKIKSRIELPAEKPWQQSATAVSTIEAQRRPAVRLRWAPCWSKNKSGINQSPGNSDMLKHEAGLHGKLRRSGGSTDRTAGIIKTSKRMQTLITNERDW